MNYLDKRIEKVRNAVLGVSDSVPRVRSSRVSAIGTALASPANSVRVVAVSLSVSHTGRV